MELRKIINISMLLSIGVVLSIIESFIPIFNGIIPGLKIGLSNIIILYVLYRYNFKDTLYIVILKVLLVAILRTGFSINFYFSIVGGILSVIFMYLTKKTKLSIIGVSIIGSIFHLIGQIIVAIVLLNSFNLIYYLPYLIIFGSISGFIIGLITKDILVKTEKIY